ncbi:MAG: hypothetical protein EAZ66_07210, partial [Alphaproteobacteria bacterium]
MASVQEASVTSPLPDHFQEILEDWHERYLTVMELKQSSCLDEFPTPPETPNDDFKHDNNSNPTPQVMGETTNGPYIFRNPSRGPPPVFRTFATPSVPGSNILGTPNQSRSQLYPPIPSPPPPIRGTYIFGNPNQGNPPRDSLYATSPPVETPRTQCLNYNPYVFGRNNTPAVTQPNTQETTFEQDIDPLPPDDTMETEVDSLFGEPILHVGRAKPHPPESSNDSSSSSATSESPQPIKTETKSFDSSDDSSLGSQDTRQKDLPEPPDYFFSGKATFNAYNRVRA